MVYLIDKDALVAEIERRIKFQQTCMKTGLRLTGKAEEEIILEYMHFLFHLNTLEVKEVDLKEIVNSFIKENLTGNNPLYTKVSVACILDKFAKYLFALGLKVKQG